jgi:hypothetical protein
MMLAGERLDQWRNAVYDFQPGEDVDEEFDDPTRRPNFDWADADHLMRVVERNRKRYERDLVEQAMQESTKVDSETVEVKPSKPKKPSVEAVE